eukprot:scaffold103962_cov66-Phaeocystis_antarctica.AAC.3
MIANTQAMLSISTYSVDLVVSPPTKALHVVRRSLRRKRAPAEVNRSSRLPVGTSESSTYSTQSHVLKMAEAVGAHKQKLKNRTEGSDFTRALVHIFPFAPS